MMGTALLSGVIDYSGLVLGDGEIWNCQSSLILTDLSCRQFIFSNISKANGHEPRGFSKTLNFVRFNEQNKPLWIEVQKQILGSEEIALAVGAATLVSRENFSLPCLPEVLTRAIEQLPPQVKLWIRRYGKRLVFARFPGTKLYLLLHRALPGAGHRELGEIRAKLLPLRRPARVTVNTGNRRLWFRLLRTRDEIRYFFFGCGSTWSRVATT